MTHGVGIVGAGSVAREYIKAFSADPRARIQGVHSRSPDRIAQLRIESGGQWAIYDSLEAMLDDPSVDIVAICSTPNVHAEQLIATVRAGKHLVIEKPLVINAAELSATRTAVAASGVTTVCGFVLRWNPMFEMLKQATTDGTLGRLFYAESDYWNRTVPNGRPDMWAVRKSVVGSSLLSAGCHAVDALRWLVGEVAEVQGWTPAMNPTSEYEFPPNLVAILRFENGAIGKVSSLLESESPYVFNVHLHGDNGTALDNRVFAPGRFENQADYHVVPTITPNSGDPAHHPFKAEIREFLDCIESGTATRSSFEDGARTMEVCLAIDESVRAGHAISLKRPPDLQPRALPQT